MFFYDIIALIAGLLALYIGIINIINPKSYKERLDAKHFKHSLTGYRLFYIFISLIFGLGLVVSSILSFNDSIEFDNKQVVFVILYASLIGLYLLITYIIERVYIEKPIKVRKIK